MRQELITKGGLLVPEGADFGGSIWARWGIQVVDGNGKTLGEQSGPCHSFLRNFGRTVRGILYVPSTTQETLTKTNNTTFSAPISTGASSTEGLVASVGKIKLGSSNAAVTSDQYELQGTILLNGAITLTSTITENTVQYVWEHELSALNGGSLYTVKELGLYAIVRGTTSGQTNETMYMRDIIADPGVDVPNGATVYARYRFTVAV